MSAYERSLSRLAAAMREKFLARHTRYGNTWEGADHQELMKHLSEELKELAEVLEDIDIFCTEIQSEDLDGTKKDFLLECLRLADKYREEVLEEAADVANMVMMLADNRLLALAKLQDMLKGRLSKL